MPAPVSGVAVSGAPAPPRPRRAGFVLAVVAVVFTLVLGAVAIVQARQISDLRGDLDRARADADRVQAGDDQRLDSLEGQVTQLGEQAGKVFDPQAVAAAVLPSVFRITAGKVTGTAFAVGSPSSGTSRLLTAYHVVQEVWGRGGNRVQLERDSETYSATVTDVDQANDIAVLSAPFEFAGLATSTEPVQSGQQIVVVGSPLGLTDSVTVGVVSALRKGEAGAGDLIQFDASINPGNSGGPVVNTAKQVVGIASLKARDSEGIGLATPIQTACTKFRVC
ncbi:trypsin-like peptidase domain-containing protein [Phytohabitans sp. ZYX-F-186]|uniref:Trypsin-like peptidase domain-containing protein n=1 Tax=Phytohabitans maris TaxID=3071409 RepID=A0ABU0ZL69_9ACTN|nr:trypsin-like peptidase domain-containing protein [Phytohabitans sp. ZYX-F-186]MDQ7907134.1 trypsin-like peptidase domain-containing protein [Phytohabitans sp. ZYX-F-186]